MARANLAAHRFRYGCRDVASKSPSLKRYHAGAVREKFKIDDTGICL
jgi:hypothetical protein